MAAQLFANQLQRNVLGSTRGMSFRGADKKYLGKKSPPETGPIYLMPDPGGEMLWTSPK